MPQCCGLRTPARLFSVQISGTPRFRCAADSRVQTRDLEMVTTKNTTSSIRLVFSTRVAKGAARFGWEPAPLRVDLEFLGFQR